MQNKNTLINAALITVSVFAVIIAFSSFRHLKRMEFEFNEKKAVIVKENLDLKDRIDSIQELVNQKIESIGILEKEKKSFEDEVSLIKKENDKIIESYVKQLDTIKKKNVTLKRKVTQLEKSPIITRIKDMIEKEDNENIKKVLADTLNKVELIKAGKSVNLEPIIVTKKETPLVQDIERSTEETGVNAQPPAPGKEGVVLSVDKKNNLVVINLGHKDNIKEGDRIKILKDGREIARAEVLSIRYRIAAAFVDYLGPRCTISDISEGCKVLVIEK